jgi:DNA invertase Pin-like site-specific DNA recombinase
MNNKRIGLYARCSTKKQDLESQIKALKEYAEKQGYEYEVFQDFAISGKKDNRQSINELLVKCRNKEFELVGVVELSRIGRNIQFICNVVKELCELGIKIVLVNSNTLIDYSTLEGSVLINALAMASDIEWRLISERNARGRAKIKENHIKVGRKDKQLSLEAIKLMNEKGMSLRQIAKELNTSPATIMRRLKCLESGHL